MIQFFLNNGINRWSLFFYAKDIVWQRIDGQYLKNIPRYKHMPNHYYYNGKNDLANIVIINHEIVFISKMIKDVI